MHIPVMAAEAIEYLAVRPEGEYLDATAGLGGHTAEIAKRLTTGIVIASDRDAESLELARKNTAEWAGRIRFQQARFSELKGIQVDGLLADLGSSRYQLTDPSRGFSILSDGPLDMRMDRTSGMTAGDLINTSAEKAIADLVYQLGGERSARRIARAIVRARPIRSTRHLAEVIERAVPRTGRLHPATRTFMALRMAVNQEQQELDALLEAVPDLVKDGGRVVMISFMSLEDRKVKWAFRELERAGRASVLTKRPVEPSEQERQANPASRSAKLRALEMHEQAVPQGGARPGLQAISGLP
ncbi:MAG: 16S rRNA (cytosine(1402)-N(4))-methyltransferase RsmH [Acidobacteria bacterium]|nr:16S rRNA (cytosine(1402)-N(4))-methyltransferase RsmH [Acidobacteriota bacterium]